MPSTCFRRNQTTKLTPNTHPKIVSAPIIWPAKDTSALVSGTSRSPSRPQVPCTEIAPTGSSILTLSRKTIENTTNTPPAAPKSVASSAVGVEGSAVIATRPASAPFSNMVKSARPNMIRAVMRAAIAPPAAAALVLRKTMATALALEISPSFNTEPPLNPNHPIQRMKVPRVASGRLAPGSAYTWPSGPYLPFREPSRTTPAKAAEAPAR